MKFLCLLALCALVAAEPQSKYEEIVKLLNQRDNLQGSAQTFSSSLADPSGYSGSLRSSERSRAKYDQESVDAKKAAEEEEERKPDRLALLLAESKFTCESLKNGYYADESVGCQVFHYCVDGVKHSWQCPENTVFHQIHLNCVPNTQDICTESSKFHVVNDYLHKQLDERGPNNSIQYHQRFYPEGFELGGGDTVTQIFRAQAQAHALAKAQRQRDPESYEEQPEQPVRTRARARQNVPAPQPSRPLNSGRPVYKPQAQPSRPLIMPQSFSVNSQALPTKRPTVYTTPASNFAPPTYTETTDEDYSNDYNPSPSSSSSSASNAAPASSFSLPTSSGFSSVPVNNAPPSSSSLRSQQSPSSQGSSRASSYPTRSLGIPIASFRVAPSQGYTPQASNIVSLRIVPSLSDDSQYRY